MADERFPAARAILGVAPTALATALCWLPFPLLAETRGIEVLPKSPDGKAVIGNAWLFLIGINQYQEWPSLRGPVNDVLDFKKVALENYWFEPENVIELYDKDATKKKIMQAFRKLVKGLRPQDSLLIYYSGHGYLSEADVGYWAPHDAGLDKDEQPNWIPASEIHGFLAKIPCRHILLIADACFSGNLVIAARSRPEEISNEFYKRAYERSSREIITSGAHEQVLDTEISGHSAFAYHLIRELQANTDPYLDPLKVFANVRAGVTRSVPLMGTLKDAGHQDGGSYLFFRRLEPATEEMIRPEPSPSSPELGSAFEVPSAAKDPHGNPVKKGTDAKTGWPLEIRHKATGMHLVFVPAGEFQMGSADGQEHEKPVHKVRITKPFYMGKYEVTQAEWQKVMGLPAAPGTAQARNNPSNSKGDSNPVETVSWDECQEFMRKLNEPVRSVRHGGSSSAVGTPRGKEPPEGGTTSLEFSLPTDAQWEYACRAGTESKFSFGDGDGALGEHAWYDENSGKKTHPVGGKKPNAWGLYDMHGNVWEWCSDWYDRGYYGESPESDPTGPADGSNRVVRGGGWDATANYCRSACRYYNSPGRGTVNLGCRAVLRLNP
jgi:formylglycine-generating enzyme required for sulfatase activity